MKIMVEKPAYLYDCHCGGCNKLLHVTADEPLSGGHINITCPYCGLVGIRVMAAWDSGPKVVRRRLLVEEAQPGQDSQPARQDDPPSRPDSPPASRKSNMGVSAAALGMGAY